MKRFYYAYQCVFPDGNECAAVEYFTTSQNIIKSVQNFGGIYDSTHGGGSKVTIIKLCETKRDAETTASAWNQTFKENGKFAFL